MKASAISLEEACGKGIARVLVTPLCPPIGIGTSPTGPLEMAIVSNCNSKAASKRECKASSSISSCVDTDNLSLTVTFTLPNVVSEIACCLPLSASSFVPISKGIPLTIVK
ncbi:hypothetical protein V1478_008359 [Vespula squamosa]|uniref:Uncharacterized protein n=1 Tax=Vespula squamosa TaxID=30214 RepID=A0ABD2ATX2_VESSQ